MRYLLDKKAKFRLTMYSQCSRFHQNPFTSGGVIAERVNTPSCICLLDLSAAFDTIDHNVLITRLSSWFGIHGSVLS